MVNHLTIYLLNENWAPYIYKSAHTDTATHENAATHKHTAIYVDYVSEVKVSIGTS